MFWLTLAILMFMGACLLGLGSFIKSQLDESTYIVVRTSAFMGLWAGFALLHLQNLLQNASQLYVSDAMSTLHNAPGSLFVDLGFVVFCLLGVAINARRLLR